MPTPEFDRYQALFWADLLLKIMSIVAIAAAGFWAYYQFHLVETDIGNVQIATSAEVLPYSDETRLLVIHARPKNIGKVSVRVGHNGLAVAVRQIPSGTKAGAIAINDLPQYYKTDIAKRFPEGYEIAPGAEYDDVVVLVVGKGAIYAVTAEFDLGGGYEVDATNLYKVE